MLFKLLPARADLVDIENTRRPALHLGRCPGAVVTGTGARDSASGLVSLVVVYPGCTHLDEHQVVQSVAGHARYPQGCNAPFPCQGSVEKQNVSQNRVLSTLFHAYKLSSVYIIN